MHIATHLFCGLELPAHKQAVGAIDERTRIVAIGAHCELGVLLRGLVVALSERERERERVRMSALY